MPGVESLKRGYGMKGGKKKACKVVKTLRQALAEILAAVVGAVIAEAVCRLIFG